MCSASNKAHQKLKLKVSCKKEELIKMLSCAAASKVMGSNIENTGNANIVLIFYRIYKCISQSNYVFI